MRKANSLDPIVHRNYFTYILGVLILYPLLLFLVFIIAMKEGGKSFYEEVVKRLGRCHLYTYREHRDFKNKLNL
jgi:lipopolysaccharide/colanic/teichoic acid biosynthesis glycosyltransferase